jgi:uncharacterized protein (DUF1015 family)
VGFVHPIERAWLTGGGTGAQNYDEFADETEITEIIRANPQSALAVEMPHRAPESAGASFAAALPQAVRRLAAAKAAGGYRPAGRAVVLYRISGGFSGMFCMVDTDQIASGPEDPGLVIRNEDVFEEKVRERVALLRATGHLLSPVLLLQTATGAALRQALEAAFQAAGPPAALDTDQAGRRHELMPLPPGPTADELCRLAGGGELVVADGNHRTLAAQTAGLPRFLAVVTTPESVTIQPYHRLVTEPSYTLDRALERLAQAGLPPRRVAGPPRPPAPGRAFLYAGGELLEVALPTDPAGRAKSDGSAPLRCAAPPDKASVIDNLDHALVERWLLREGFELDPGDKRVVYVGGDYPVSWLAGEVDSGRAVAAILVAPVSVPDFVAVNLARQKMPRKSTWFTPKARAGLVLAELA